jgi:hypothetical protein
MQLTEPLVSDTDEEILNKHFEWTPTGNHRLSPQLYGIPVDGTGAE